MSADAPKQLNALEEELARLGDDVDGIRAFAAALARRLHAAEERARQAEKLAAVGALGSGVAHEINNPLAGLIGNLSYLGAELKTLRPLLGEQLHRDLVEALDDSRLASDRIRQVVRDLRNLAWAEDAMSSPSELKPVVDMALNLTSARISRRARLEVAITGNPLARNANRVGQALVHLLSWIAATMPDGRADLHRVKLEIGPTADGCTLIRLTDTRADVAQDSFGLGIAYAIAQQLGGHLVVDSQGAGTLVTLELPPPSVVPAALDRAA